jgi:hypothetical protein
MTFESITPLRIIAAEVSSQEDSIPNIVTFILKNSLKMYKCRKIFRKTQMLSRNGSRQGLRHYRSALGLFQIFATDAFACHRLRFALPAVNKVLSYAGHLLASIDR